MDRRRFIRNTGLVTAALTGLGSGWEENPQPSAHCPPSLKKGDKVAVIAPGGAVFNKRYIDSITAVLRELELVPEVKESCYSQYGQFSADEKTRADELMTCFTDPYIRAIIGMRGGSGCARMLPLLDYDLIRANPTILVGFSDMTSLLNAIHLKSGLITYHGPVGYSTWNLFSVNAFKNVLFEGKPHRLANHPDSEKFILSAGVAEGPLAGGNLTVLCSLAGTPYFPVTNGRILLLEEIDEEPYVIDRMLTQIKQMGVLEGVSGILLGDFKRCVPEEPGKAFSLRETFEANLGGLKIPVIGGANFGHTLNKWTLPIGIRVRINSQDHSVELLDQTVY